MCLICAQAHMHASCWTQKWPENITKRGGAGAEQGVFRLFHWCFRCLWFHVSMWCLGTQPPCKLEAACVQTNMASTFYRNVGLGLQQFIISHSMRVLFPSPPPKKSPEFHLWILIFSTEMSLTGFRIHFSVSVIPSSTFKCMGQKFVRKLEPVTSSTLLGNVT